MDTSSHIEPAAREIRAAAETLADASADHGALRAAANHLFDRLAEWVELDDRSPSEVDLADTWVDGGRAISPREAARCLREYMRSSKYMRGVQAAIEAMRARFPGETIEVLYAGCGPFAPLVLPLAHRWAPGEVAYTLLDIHQRSLDAAASIARRLGVDDRVRARVCADAIEYQVEPAVRPHVLVTETMLQALRNETQVAVCRNLVPQIRAGGVLVPKHIELFATLMNYGLEIHPDHAHEAPPRVELGRIMSLNQDNAARCGDCAAIDWPAVPPARVTPMVRTRIEVFDDIVLGDGECSLNLPMVLPMPDPDRVGPEVGERLDFRYRMHPAPGLVAEWRGERRPAPPMPTYRPTVTTPADAEADPAAARLRLPLRFDPAPLQTELDALLDGAWAKHPNQQDYDGEWRVLALRSVSGASADVVAVDAGPDAYRATPALTASPALAEVIAALPGRVTSARLLSLAEGAVIREHRDRGTQLWDGIVRLHVPIRTHAGVDFRIAGERVTMAAGDCWYINANYPHSVRNDGPGDRVHLVVDCLVDDALIDLFLASGHPPRPQTLFSDRSLNADNIAGVIEALEAMQGEGGRAMAARLRDEAREAGVALG